MTGCRAEVRLFQSTLPAWGETVGTRLTPVKAAISIHSPRMGRDCRSVGFGRFGSLFQSTLPAWGETRRSRPFFPQNLHFNPLSPHGERLRLVFVAGHSFHISIHSPRMGRDDRRESRCLCQVISIHSPRMGRDLWVRNERDRRALFQSTLPAWGETCHGCSGSGRRRFQSTLPAWGETHAVPVYHDGLLISIHSPRMGRDPFGRVYSALSAISIHSPRMGRDLLGVYTPHSRQFQSTLPAWGETAETPVHTPKAEFQSTLPAWGETSHPFQPNITNLHFNPLSPHGERPPARFSWLIL